MSSYVDGVSGRDSKLDGSLQRHCLAWLEEGSLEETRARWEEDMAELRRG